MAVWSHCARFSSEFLKRETENAVALRLYNSLVKLELPNHPKNPVSEVENGLSMSL